jgi:hypothetical protein
MSIPWKSIFRLSHVTDKKVKALRHALMKPHWLKIGACTTASISMKISEWHHAPNNENL